MRGRNHCSAPLQLAPPCLPDLHYDRCAAERAQPGHRSRRRNAAMAWTTPTLVEICIGLEINGYLPAEI
jgi:coenzyme PQQ precursor peptide PqqA